MNDDANTTGARQAEAGIKSNLDAMRARAQLSVEDQLNLINAGVPSHQPLPADWRSRLQGGLPMTA